MEISNNTLYNFLSEGLDRFSRAKETEAKQAVLLELENTLRVINTLSGVPEHKELSESGNVVWALDPSNAPWAAAGVPASDRLTWEAFNQPPVAAGEWHRLGVAPGMASLLATNKVTPALYKQWVEFYDIDTTQPPESQHAFFTEVMTFLAENTTTPPQSKTWLSVGVPLRDIPGWKLHGQTPAGAKKKLDAGVTLASLVGQESPVPGTSYAKVVKLADRHGWTIDPPKTTSWYYTVELHKGSNKVGVRFSRTGRLSSVSASGDIAEVMTSKDPRSYNRGYRYFHGRGYKTLEEILGLPA